MTIFFDEIGNGFPIVLLHGFPFDHHLWDPVRPCLPEGYRFIFPDLRGFGKTVLDDSGMRIEEMARDVILLMDDLDLGEAIVAGHSMGGYIALDITRQIPDRIVGLVLIASHIFADSKEKQSERLTTVQQLDNATPSEVFSSMARKLSFDQEVQEYCRNSIRNACPIGIKGAMHAMAYRNSSEKLWIQIATPKLLLAGSEDQFIPPELSDMMARTGRDVIYKRLDGAGHMLMREKPDETAAAITSFIESIRRI